MTDEPVSVIETHAFARQAEKIWDESERSALIDHLAFNPEAGVVIPGTGGVRKLRWGRAGMGKRGGARVIYYYYHEDAPLYLITAYAKSETEDVPQADKRGFAALIEGIKAEFAQNRTIQ